MSKLNWDKTNKEKKMREVSSRSDSSFFDTEVYKNILKHEELLKQLSLEGDGQYKIPLMERLYAKSGFKTRSEFEDYMIMEVTEKQKEARLETCVFTRLSGGKFKGFSYIEVWKAQPDYILWIYANAKNPEHRKRVLQNIDLCNEFSKLFEKYTLHD
jgi:hypothetical protein